MTVTAHVHPPLVPATRAHDGRIIGGYVIFAAIFLAVLYFAGAGPGTSDQALIAMAAMP